LESDQRQRQLNIPLNYFDAEMELHEHHCLGDEIPTLPSVTPDSIGDDPLNAWIPRGATLNQRNVSVLCSLLRISFCLQTASPLSREKWRDGSLSG